MRWVHSARASSSSIPVQPCLVRLQPAPVAVSSITTSADARVAFGGYRESAGCLHGLVVSLIEGRDQAAAGRAVTCQ